MRLRHVAAALLVASCGDASTPSPAPAPKPATPAVVDENSDAARTARGERRVAEALRKCVAECPHSFARPDAEERTIRERLNLAELKPWADVDEWTRLDAAMTKIRARESRMNVDPRYFAGEKKRAWVKENPLFKDVAITWLFDDPYVIFQEVKTGDVRDTKRVYDEANRAWTEKPLDGTVNPVKAMQNEEWAKKGELFAKRDARILAELHRRFRELFAKEFKLPELRDKGRVLSVLVMWNHASFDKLMREAGQPVSDSCDGFYSPPQQTVFTFLGDDSLQGEDVRPCADGRVQKIADQTLFACGAQQLVHEYGAVLRGSPLKDSDQRVEPATARWFDFGFAELLAGAETDEASLETLEGAKWSHERVKLDRVVEGRAFRESAAKWRLADLLKPDTLRDVEIAGKKLDPSDAQTTSHFACRAWAFCHFLWHYDGGKYRPALVAEVRDALAGTQSRTKLDAHLRSVGAADWRQVEREFDWYWDQLLDRDVRRSKETREWTRVSTEAPTGNANGR